MVFGKTRKNWFHVFVLVFAVTLQTQGRALASEQVCAPDLPLEAEVKRIHDLIGVTQYSDPRGDCTEVLGADAIHTLNCMNLKARNFSIGREMDRVDQAILGCAGEGGADQRIQIARIALLMRDQAKKIQAQNRAIEESLVRGNSLTEDQKGLLTEQLMAASGTIELKREDARAQVDASLPRLQKAAQGKARATVDLVDHLGVKRSEGGSGLQVLDFSGFDFAKMKDSKSPQFSALAASFGSSVAERTREIFSDHPGGRKEDYSAVILGNSAIIPHVDPKTHQPRGAQVIPLVEFEKRVRQRLGLFHTSAAEYLRATKEYSSWQSSVKGIIPGSGQASVRELERKIDLYSSEMTHQLDALRYDLGLDSADVREGLRTLVEVFGQGGKNIEGSVKKLDSMMTATHVTIDLLATYAGVGMVTKLAEIGEAGELAKTLTTALNRAKVGIAAGTGFSAVTQGAGAVALSLNGGGNLWCNLGEAFAGAAVSSAKSSPSLALMGILFPPATGALKSWLQGAYGLSAQAAASSAAWRTALVMGGLGLPQIASEYSSAWDKRQQAKDSAKLEPNVAQAARADSAQSATEATIQAVGTLAAVPYFEAKLGGGGKTELSDSTYQEVMKAWDQAPQSLRLPEGVSRPTRQQLGEIIDQSPSLSRLQSELKIKNGEKNVGVAEIASRIYAIKARLRAQIEEKIRSGTDDEVKDSPLDQRLATLDARVNAKVEKVLSAAVKSCSVK